jgi:hypothetical protein
VISGKVEVSRKIFDGTDVAIDGGLGVPSASFFVDGHRDAVCGAA